MKLTTTRNVETNTGNLESHKIAIEANGKAFTTLVRGIYENKVRSFIREIASNAFDAHIEAGTPELPFRVDGPDALDPYFRVRDFGPSMDHDTVVNVFGTLFASTKDQSNDVVGAFGLGSKSPLAYSDSYEVTAYLDGEVRSYLVSITETGQPQLTLLSQTSTDEPNGLEVAIPIRREDFVRVEEEARDVLAAFPVLPDTVGFTVDPLTPILSVADGSSHIVKNTGRSILVRMGCVVYPVDNWEIRRSMPPIRFGYSLMLDVPIGTVGVTTSREALELSPQSIDMIQKMVADAAVDVEAKVNSMFDDCKNRLEAIGKMQSQSAHEWWDGSLKFQGKVLDRYIRLNGESNGRDGALLHVRKGKSRQVVDYGMVDYMSRGEVRIVHGDAVRRSIRYREFVNLNGESNTYYTSSLDRVAVERLIRLAGFTSDNFVHVSTLPDPGPVKRDSNGKTRGRGIPQGAKVEGNWGYDQIETPLPEKFYWIEHVRPTNYDATRDKEMLTEAVEAGAEQRKIVCVTPSARKRLKLNDENSLRVVWEKALADKAGGTGDELFIAWLVDMEVPSHINRALPDLFPKQDHKMGDTFQYLPEERRLKMKEAARERLAAIKVKYPMLFQPGDSVILTQYVEQMDKLHDDD